MNKYYYNDFLVRKSNNLYTFAVGCIINGKLKVYGCHRNLELATKKFNETKILLEKTIKVGSTYPKKTKNILAKKSAKAAQNQLNFNSII